MFDFFERRKFRRLMYSKVALLCLLFVVVFLAKGVWDVYSKEREASRLVRERQAELKDIEARQTALVAELKKLSTARGIEEELRQKYEVAREGEKVIVLVDPPKEDSPHATESSKGFWGWFKSLFKR